MEGEVESDDSEGDSEEESDDEEIEGSEEVMMNEDDLSANNKSGKIKLKLMTTIIPWNSPVHVHVWYRI